MKGYKKNQLAHIPDDEIEKMYERAKREVECLVPREIEEQVKEKVVEKVKEKEESSS